VRVVMAKLVALPPSVPKAPPALPAYPPPGNVPGAAFGK